MSDERRLPALTGLEADLLDGYLRVLVDLGRLNPARTRRSYDALRAAQALSSHAAALCATLTTMVERGDADLFPSTLGRALRTLGAADHLVRLTPTSDR